MLDVTDNLRAGQVVPPPGVVRHDGDDPYLVVAADKGTATFSDTANEISTVYFVPPPLQLVGPATTAKFAGTTNQPENFISRCRPIAEGLRIFSRRTPLALAMWAARTFGPGGAAGAAQPPASAVSGSAASATPSAPAAIPALAVPPALPPAAGTGRAP